MVNGSDSKNGMEYRVLVVDDEPMILAAIRKVLHTEGFVIDDADSVPAARMLMAETKYCALLTDLMMPGEYGDVLLREALAANPDLPAVLISGYATVENALGTIRDGAFDFLPKPFSFDELGALAMRLKRFLNLSLEKRGDALRPKPVPEDDKEHVFCLGGHAWTILHGDGTASIGAGKIPAFTSGQVALARLPREGESIVIGHHFAHFIDSEGYEHPILAPLSGRVLKVDAQGPLSGEDCESFAGGTCRLVTILPMDLDGELGLLSRCLEGKPLEE